MVTEGCTVGGKIERSVLFAGVTVEKDAEVIESIVMPGAVIKAGAKIYKTIVGENAVIGENAKVGCPGGKVTLVGPEMEVADGAAVEDGAIAGKEAIK